MLGRHRPAKAQPGRGARGIRPAAKLQPNSPDVLNNRAMALFDLGQTEEALASLDRALALRPDYREALINRAGLLDALRRFGESAETYARLMAPCHRISQVLGSLPQASDERLRLDRLREDLRRDRRPRRARRAGRTTDVIYLAFAVAVARSGGYTEDYAARKLSPAAAASRSPAEHGRIRLAYLSSDFREHPISYMFVRSLRAARPCAASK